MKTTLLFCLYLVSTFGFSQNNSEKLALRSDLKIENINYSSFINPKFNLESNSKKYISQQASKVNSLICFKVLEGRKEKKIYKR